MLGVSQGGWEDNKKLCNMICRKPLMMTGREEPDIPNTPSIQILSDIPSVFWLD